MKFALKIALLILVLFVFGRLYYRLTDGFRMGNVTMELPYQEKWQPRLSETETLQTALNQPYHYLDKGHQAYVFESEDGQFVLKLLKFQRVRIPQWLRKTELPFFEQWRLKRIEKKDRMLQSLLTSWKLGFDELKEEAAIVYVHIVPSHNLQKNLKITDKIGLKHTLELDRTIFLIQRKAPLLGPTLDSLMVQNRSNEAKAVLDRLVGLFVSEYRRGLAEKELFILRNTGVLEGRPIHIDTGRFEWDLSLKENYRPELRRKTAKLLEWLREQHPELARHFEEQVEKA